jgi:hypothetical protein
MRFAFIEAWRHQWRIATLCRVMRATNAAIDRGGYDLSVSVAVLTWPCWRASASNIH